MPFNMHSFMNKRIYYDSFFLVCVCEKKGTIKLLKVDFQFFTLEQTTIYLFIMTSKLNRPLRHRVATFFLPMILHL